MSTSIERQNVASVSSKLNPRHFISAGVLYAYPPHAHGSAPIEGDLLKHLTCFEHHLQGVEVVGKLFFKLFANQPLR